ncbi:hypothetical protein Kintu_gp8 [Xanthomonas phage Kintu]
MTPEQHAAKIRELEAPMAAAYLAEVRAVESAATVAEVERLIAEDDRDGLAVLLSLGSLTLFTELFRTAFIQGAQNELAGRWRFDSNTWAVINLLMGEYRSISDTAAMDLRKTIDVVMANGNTNRNKALDLLGVKGTTARRTGGMVGLPVQMSEWVESARQQLLSGDRAAMRAYLTRKLRDTAYDRFVVPGAKLTIEQANTISRAYSARLLQSYAKQLAQTYAQQAYNAGRNHAIQQLLDNGTITQDQVQKKWRTMRDERVRHSHATMNNQRVGFMDPFVSGLGGLLMYPGDTSLGASDADIYNCRCSLEYTISRRF